MAKRSVKIFLCGEYKVNAGPSNVNRRLLNASDEKIYCLRSENKILKILECIYKIILCDVTIFSGYNGRAKIWLKMIKMFGKKAIYLMHGCVAYENQINNLNIPKKAIEIEKYIFNRVHLILCVSEKYMEWVENSYPFLKGKLHYLNSGFDEIQGTCNDNLSEDGKYYVAVAGGDRKQKNNGKVSAAVEWLNSSLNQNQEIYLNVYGRKYSGENEFSDNEHTNYRGMLSFDEFISELRHASVFVINSTVESFGLSAIDALNAGCSIIVSENTGLCSIVKLEENDIIHDVDDEKEIANKIEYILNNPNNSRILKSLDYKRYAWKNVAKRLVNICWAVVNGEDYSIIK